MKSNKIGKLLDFQSKLEYNKLIQQNRKKKNELYYFKKIKEYNSDTTFKNVWRKTERINEPIIQVKNKYEWGESLFNTYEEAKQVKKEYGVRLSNEIYIDLMDLIYTACPVEAAQDKSWQQGARDLIFGMALRMWEDVRDGYLPKEKFNIYNLWWNLTQYAKNDCEVLKEYINDCADETSRAPGMANTVLVSEDRTLSSYLGSVNQYLHLFSDGAITQLTSGNDIEFSKWDEEPNVLFIKYPEEKETRHSMVALLMVQLYKALLEKAGVNSELKETADSKLKRTCYFLMDEFGQLPKIHRFELIVPIARSKRIFFLPVIQSYTQLDAVYGEKNAGTIRDNCPIKIFLGTDNPKTCEEFSAACGKQKIKSVSYNENRDMSVSTSAQSVPLIYPSELSKLNDPDNGVFGNAIIKDVSGYITGRKQFSILLCVWSCTGRFGNFIRPI
ncbi:MAG: type IV secretory system conjugative DNA transfer family protein [Clostridiales bacterium]|nr:type IV secretory system conjugative DNA transfer family protein [Clostridiales bacterium]